MDQLERNSTSFQTKLMEYLKGLKFEHRYSWLAHYQNITRVYLRDLNIVHKNIVTRPRGLLIYYTMGLGKSIAAVSIAMDHIERNNIIFLMSKSLQANMIKAIKQYVRLRAKYDREWPLGQADETAIDEFIKTRFSFVSLNASNMIGQVGRAAASAAKEFEAGLNIDDSDVADMSRVDLNGKLLIVDEAHNLFRAIINGSKNALGLYNAVIKSNCKVVFLTGTPINNDPFELVPCFNMLTAFKDVPPILPVVYKDFCEMFVSETGIKNKAKFQNRIMGLVSYMTHTLESAKNIGEFPAALPDKIVRVSMSRDQFLAYQLARDKEVNEGTGQGGGSSGFNANNLPAMIKPKSKSSSSYRVKSRQLSNYCPPTGLLGLKSQEIMDNLAQIPDDQIRSPKLEALIGNLAAEGTAIIYSQFIGAGGLGVIARYLEINGYSRYAAKTEPANVPKLALAAADNLSNENNRETSILNDITPDRPKDGGAGELSADSEMLFDNLIAKLETYSLKIGGDRDYKKDDSAAKSNTTDTKKFALITGDVDFDTRVEIQNIFNSRANMNGEIISVLLISSTGAEGLDLKNVRNVHIFEPYWNYARIAQIKARAIRNGSHIALPPTQRVVQSFIYLAVDPNEKIKTTDEELFEESIANQTVIDDFLHALQEVSIECAITAKKCRVCAPTDVPLFTQNIVKDLETTDPCGAFIEKSVEAREIVVNGIAYKYIEAAESIFEYEILVYNKTLGSYVKMSEDDDRFAHILEKINLLK